MSKFIGTDPHGSNFLVTDPHNGKKDTLYSDRKTAINAGLRLIYADAWILRQSYYPRTEDIDALNSFNCPPKITMVCVVYNAGSLGHKSTDLVAYSANPIWADVQLYDEAFELLAIRGIIRSVETA
jgi:hypothetical protein